MTLSEAEYRLLLRRDLYTFIERSFVHLNPEEAFLHNWHLEKLAEELEKCRCGETRRLIITVPPRSLKSHAVSVAFVAWLLAHNPCEKVLCVSYGQGLADKHAGDCRKIMQASWYLRAFKTRLASSRPPVHDFQTTENGYRLSTSIGGPVTGRGANYIIIDDPLKPDEALSDTQRNAVNQCYDHTLLSRLNNKETGCIIVIMQRLHEDDLVGHLMQRGGWKLLSFPAIAEEDECHEIFLPFGRGSKTVIRKAGEALHPERESLETLQWIRQTVGEYVFSGQYQQAPVPFGGGMVKVAWLKYYTPAEKPQQFEQVFQSWDTASKPSELSDFSVCTTWGMTRDKHLYLLDVYRARLEYPSLKRTICEKAGIYGAKTILIEDKASGIQLIQDLINDGMHGVKAYKPKDNKVMRMNSVTSTIENGFVHLPDKAPWLPEYIHELTSFPSCKYDDQADSTSQALDWVKSGMHYHGLIQLWMEQAEAMKAMAAGVPYQPLLCPICGKPRAQYGEAWNCAVCGASGTGGRQARPSKCPKCQHTLFARVGQQWRCQHCGQQYGEVKIAKAPTRSDILK